MSTSWDTIWYCLHFKGKQRIYFIFYPFSLDLIHIYLIFFLKLLHFYFLYEVLLFMKHQYCHCILHILYLEFCMICYKKGEIMPILHCKIRLCFWSFSVITKVIAWKTQYIISDWLHTPYQTIFMVIYWIFKISSFFSNYL